jgi:hypothetical protein
MTDDFVRPTKAYAAEHGIPIVEIARDDPPAADPSEREETGSPG